MMLNGSPAPEIHQQGHQAGGGGEFGHWQHEILVGGDWNMI
jgi:hypothetical protein